MAHYGKYQFEGLNDQRICVILSKIEKSYIKHCTGKEQAMTWAHLERRESCERSYRRTEGRKERKRKAKNMMLDDIRV